MALAQLSLAPNTIDGVTNGVDARPTSVDGGDEGNKAPRLPRWTRQEILVLIQGKRVAENRVRRGRNAGLAFGSSQVEPKWASVSSYCKRHGVNRGPVQCRKRWSNLAGDYKKIKEWESQIRDETESFWLMRNDLRRERKLPGFFDREVYDILAGGPMVSPALDLALAPSSAAAEDEGKMPVEEAETAEVVFDSGRSAAVEDGLFSDFEQEEGGASSEKEAAANDNTPVAAPGPVSDTTKERPAAKNPEIGSTSQDRQKRKRFAADGEEETTNLQYQLVDVLERNGNMLSAQLEAHNNNFQMDREQRKDHADSLVAVLNKLADALGRIADKL